MSWAKIFAVIRREYLERVRTKAFWFATFLVPVFFLGYMAVQFAAIRKASGERRVAIVDRTGQLAEPLARELAEREEARRKENPGSRGIHWILEPRAVTGDVEATKEALRKEVLDKKIYGYLVLDPELLEKDRAEYYSISVSEFVALDQMERAINRTILRRKIAERGLPASLSKELEKRVDLKTLKVTSKGTTEEKGAGIIASIVFLAIMYMTFFMYGFQNLRGVIEEKTNRIVELIIASVRPTELMVGKIVGIGLVGLTQYLVWSLVAMNLSLPGIASLMAMGEGGAGHPTFDDRVLPAVLYPRLLPLREHLHGDRRTLQQRPGSPAARDDSIDADRERNGGLPGGHEQSERVRRRLRFSLPLHRAAHHVPADGDRRAAAVADRAGDRDPHPLDDRDGVVRGADLPGWDPHVRQKADDPRNSSLGALPAGEGPPAGSAAIEPIANS